MKKKLPPGVAEINQFYGEVNKLFEKAGEGASLTEQMYDGETTTRKPPTIPDDQNIPLMRKQIADLTARLEAMEKERERLIEALKNCVEDADEEFEPIRKASFVHARILLASLHPRDKGGEMKESTERRYYTVTPRTRRVRASMNAKTPGFLLEQSHVASVSGFVDTATTPTGVSSSFVPTPPQEEQSNE